MDGLEISLIFGLIVLLVAVMFLAYKIQKLHRHARYLRHLVQKLEGSEEARPNKGEVPAPAQMEDMHLGD